jgi:hypothetical protein
MSSYLQKKIIITGQNDAEGKIYVTGYEEELPDIELDQTHNKVNIDDDKIVEQVANIKSVFGSSRTDQAPTQTPTEAEAPAPAAQTPTPTPTPATDVTTPATDVTTPATDVTTPATDVTTPTEAPITIKEFNSTEIPWRGNEHKQVLDYIKWIKREKQRGNLTKYKVDTLVNNVLTEYNRLIKKGSITQEELDSFFKLTENIKQIGGKTKKLRAFRKKTLRNQRNSKKRLGSRKNIR